MALSVASYTNIANWFVTTTPRTVTGVAWSAGDIVVVVGGNENAIGTMANPTNANLTFGAPKASSTSGGGAECTVYVWASAAAAGAQTGQTITSSATGGLQWGFAVLVITGAPTGFANAIANLTEAAISRTVSAGSIGIYCAIDFNATNPPGKTPATGSGTAVERRDAGNGTNYAQYIATWEGTSAGTFSFGPNNYTGLQVAQCFIEILAPAGGAVQLVVQDALHDHTVDNVALTQHNVLAVADTVHGHSVDTLSLVVDLIVADTVHGHTVDNVTLVQHNVLVVADATHGHTVDAVTLTQHNVLVVADATHGHTVDNVTLSVAGSLGVNDTAHGHTVDNVALTQHNVLAVQDALHGHTADGVALTQHYVLTVQDAAHSHIVDAVTLGVGGVTLVVADALHGHSVDTLALTQHNVLVVADALHVQLAAVVVFNVLVLVGPLTTGTVHRERTTGNIAQGRTISSVGHERSTTEAP